MKVDTNPRKIKALVDSRFIDKIYPSRAKLEEALRSGKRLTIYHGVDPTAPDLHLGHSTNFLLLRELQKLGHRIILLVGDFTARIGDPTDKLSARKPFTEKEVKNNSKTYKNQAGKILSFTGANPAEIAFNSRWLKRMNFEDLIKLSAKLTHAQIIKRDMFRRRIKEDKEIFLHEFLYPLMQGYDSVALKTDAEVGGTDQTFNMLVGRDLEKAYLNKEKFVITTPLLENPKTGRKLMSKSEGGYISLQDSPAEMYGKLMALPDEVIIPCLELCTEYPQEQIEGIKKGFKRDPTNPRDAKLILGYEVVKIYYGKEKAQDEQNKFINTILKKGLPKEKAVHSLTLELPFRDIIYVLVNGGLASSKSSAWRLVNQGAVKIDSERIDNPKHMLAGGELIEVGKKRHFLRVRYRK
ncbi:MAG: tyrosine--tRNA ligase [Candidatus Colwellbacteria bacterium]|nr:tyrosine--tRNA ligase [Candidatus Colwellbacteria bacterium]